MNALVDYPLPLWMDMAFLLAIPLPFVLIVLWLRKTDSNSIWAKAGLFFVGYLLYIGLCSAMGWFDAVSLPPRVLLLTTFPYAFLLFAVVARTKTFQATLEQSSLHSLVGLHIFRLIGIFFVLLALHDALPKPFAFIAGFGDMLTALSSIFVVQAIRQQKSYARKLTFYWNVFGTVDILFTAIAANVLTKISMDTGSMGVDALAAFPFCIIPAFAPPTILFLHWLTFKKLKTTP